MSPSKAAAPLASSGWGARPIDRRVARLVARAATLAALACGAQPVLATQSWLAGERAGSSRPSTAGQSLGASQSSLLILRDWLPAGVVALALPVPLPAAPEDETVRQVADLALAGALRESVAGLPARIDVARTRTARFFVGTALPEDLPQLLLAMRQASSRPLPLRHVEAAMARVGRERGFRDGSPEDRHGRLFAARLGLVHIADSAAAPSPADPPPPSPAGEDSAFASFIAEVSRAPEEAWAPSAWVVVSDRARPGLPPSHGDASEQPATRDEPFLLPADEDLPSERSRLANVRETAEIVTAWVGVAYELPPGTTLREAEFLRTALGLHAERRLGSAVYEFSAEVGPRGRLLLQFSAAPEAARSVEVGIAETLAAMSAQDAGSELAELHGTTRSRRSQRLADPAVLASAAAGALLRGAAPSQALSLVQPGSVPTAKRLAAVAHGARLVVRAELGPP